MNKWNPWETLDNSKSCFFLNPFHIETVNNNQKLVFWCPKLWRKDRYFNKVRISQIDNFINLGAYIYTWIRKDRIKRWIQQSRKVIDFQNSLLRDECFFKKSKNVWLNQWFVCYGYNECTLNLGLKRKLTAVKMNYLRRCSIISKLEKLDIPA